VHRPIMCRACCRKCDGGWGGGGGGGRKGEVREICEEEKKK